MAVNIKKIVGHLGLSEEQIAEQLCVEVSYLKSLENDEQKLSQDMIHKFADLCDVPTSFFMNNFIIHDHPLNLNDNEIVPKDEWQTINTDKMGLLEYIEKGYSMFQESPVCEEIEKIRTCCNSLRKPKVSLAGQSDSGKSTLINTLIGAERMPAKWTPTTSIIVYLKHVDDRPDYISDNVWIFKRVEESIWNDTMLNDENESKKYLLASGDYSILETYGIHQEESSSTKEAVSAVAFIDSPLLKCCDILDIPGFAATDEDNALHKFIAQDSETDILIYLSRANGFLQEGDIDYLNICINALNPLEIKGKNNIDKLENLFIVASQSGAVNQGNAAELKEILERRCAELTKQMRISADASDSCSLLPLRTKQTGYNYEPSDFKARFFTYEKEIPRLCSNFNKAFSALIEKIPLAYHTEFVDKISALKNDSSEKLSQKIEEYLSIIEERDNFHAMLHDIEENELQRKLKQESRNEKMYDLITDLKSKSKEEYSKFYFQTMTEDNLVQMIKDNEYKNIKSDKDDFGSFVKKYLTEKFQTILTNYSEEYSKALDLYLHDYEESIQHYSLGNNTMVKFSTGNAFADGLSNLKDIGASGVWLSKILNPIMLDEYVKYYSVRGAVAAVAFAILNIHGVGIALIFDALTWKKSLAKSIIKEFSSNNYLDKVFGQNEDYWKQTQHSVKFASDCIETEWLRYIDNIRELAGESDISKLKQKLNYTKQGLSFFENIPLQLSNEEVE